MSRSLEETRRDFLVRLARTAGFVAPVVLSLDAAPLAAQGGGAGQGGGKGAGQATVVGSLTPTSQSTQQQLESDPTVPWDPTSGQAAPWSVPPPTSTG
jgi:hypothetical protein